MKVKANLLLTALALLTLTSCNETIDSSHTGGSTIPSDNSSSVDPYPGWTQGSNQIEGATQPLVKRPKGTKNELGIMRNGQDRSGLPQKGQANILVVPVQFNGEKDAQYTKAMTDDLETSFFGEAYTFDMQSVQEYYKASSYGNLDINGVVAPTYSVDFSANDLLVKANYTSVSSVLSDIMADIYATYFTGDTATYDPHDFDSDSDGFIDNIVLVYAESYISNLVYSFSTTAMQTLYTTLFGNSTYFHESYASKNVPVGSFTWESYYDGYTFDSTVQTIKSFHDNHAYIKQVGVALGLSDYSDSYSIRSPLGGLDMMDGGILDHNPFSKYLLGWIEPTVIDSSTDIESSYTLNDFQDDGSVLLLTNESSTSPYGEYLMVAYYTPTGLNEVDSDYSNLMKEVLAGSYPYELYVNSSDVSKSGIQVFKIDSRLVLKTDSGYAFNSENLDFEKNSYDFAYSNGSYAPYAEYGVVENYALVELLSRNGMNRHMTDKSVKLSSDDFFQNGDKFGSDDQVDGFYKDFEFDDDSKLGLSFEVTSLGEDSAALTFERG